MRRLIAAIARELDALYGGGRGVDWVGVERHLAHIADQARRDGRRLSDLIEIEYSASRRSAPGVGSPRSGLSERLEGGPR